MKAYVKISSTINIVVNGGLKFQDFTDRKSDIPNRLKISATWPQTTVNIKQGVGYYPSEITKWNIVKNLVKDKILTIGEEVDETTDEYAIQMKEKLAKFYPTQTKKVKEE